MALSTNVGNVVTAIATKFKTVLTVINGNDDTGATRLATTATTLVDAINEVKTTADSAAGGGVAIDDSQVRTDATYSSDKIVELDDALQSAIDAKPSINDSASNTTTVWSGSKVASEIANVSVDLTELIDDETASTSTVYSSTETDARIGAEVAALVDAAPGTLDTLNELAAALGDDPNFATTVSNDIGEKVSHAEVQSLDATAQGRARTNIGAASQADLTTLTNNVGNTEENFVTIFNNGLA